MDLISKSFFNLFLEQVEDGTNWRGTNWKESKFMKEQVDDEQVDEGTS
jgi:hypothetical protein